ncbi:hypothetical protein CLM62_15555 [Streptomyces sp. SA15]|uniref:DUF6777 domain-containing protein n=1 Tax=Streptomyces sp. SA15 TaxID=934019 RepID=UPI000BAF171E|nr:DUF6777 domain-containing protein [Streptomyces sp. SA15]PAZ15026.1 hypothetical protein CLM62_15555 [Streptomyces sp. SA15]
MRTPTGTLVAACALSAALIVAGCGGDGDEDTKSSGELVLQPVADPGPDPFTDSTATSTATPSPVTRTPQPAPPEPTVVRSVSGGMPGLYGGEERVGSCDVERQIGHLRADPAKARAFAQVAGVSQASVPDYLRGLAPVELRADTRVTNHGFRDGHVTTYQAVLQAGTAVLVDNRGVPRVRCACGNPLKPPVVMRGSPGTHGRPWVGFRPMRVVVVAPTVQVITNITIIDSVDHTWIERRIGHDARHDRSVPAPDAVASEPEPAPSPDGGASSALSGTLSGEGGVSPADGSDERASPGATDCVTPTVTGTPGVTEGTPIDTPTDMATDMPTDMPTDTPIDTPTDEPTDCPTATATATATPTPPTTEPDVGTTVPEEPTEEPTAEKPTEPDALPNPSDATGPESVPETPDLPDGGGLIPDADDPAGTDSV